MKDGIRKTFEDWISTRPLVKKYYAKLHRGSDGSQYTDVRVNGHWVTWKAALSRVRIYMVVAVWTEGESILDFYISRDNAQSRIDDLTNPDYCISELSGIPFGGFRIVELTPKDLP